MQQQPFEVGFRRTIRASPTRASLVQPREEPDFTGPGLPGGPQQRRAEIAPSATFSRPMDDPSFRVNQMGKKGPIVPAAAHIEEKIVIDPDGLDRAIQPLGNLDPTGILTEQECLKNGGLVTRRRVPEGKGCHQGGRIHAVPRPPPRLPHGILLQSIGERKPEDVERSDKMPSESGILTTAPETIRAGDGSGMPERPGPFTPGHVEVTGHGLHHVCREDSRINPGPRTRWRNPARVGSLWFLAQSSGQGW